MKNIIRRWFEKLEAANKASFGSQPLDCCTVGKDKKNVKPMKMTQSRK